MCGVLRRPPYILRVTACKHAHVLSVCVCMHTWLLLQERMAFLQEDLMHLFDDMGIDEGQ